MRKNLRFIAALILTTAAVAAPRPGGATTCINQCESAFNACYLQCAGNSDCVVGCLDQRDACECNICRVCR